MFHFIPRAKLRSATVYRTTHYLRPFTTSLTEKESELKLKPVQAGQNHPSMPICYLDSRLSRLQDSFLKVTTDLGEIKATINKIEGSMKEANAILAGNIRETNSKRAGSVDTIKWQIGSALVAVIGGWGTLLGFLVKDKLLGP
ncbi:hypothetical protein L873DRAFT_1796085 [Choiromyces venosus 120613-1]|uniref:Uncharacterized protein n=1 Tax=Choiromyces venosus 120613-1 TaxID=1336337 RepID=A0A3N4ITC2_9PEZI|nr:hypothetical protein L873DRAFT_1796085 [Choiromyces venosus 120613-1]